MSIAEGTVQLEVPSLESTVIGLHDDDLVQFRGIPYASVNERWTHSQKLMKLTSPYEAISYGPRCPQLESKDIITGQLCEPDLKEDEFECLNLNIAAPSTILEKSERERNLLPVMVWIHGGAFAFGANSASRTEPQRLCRLAMKQGNPIVLVQIGYRLGPFGFAAPPGVVLQSEAASSASPLVQDSLVGNFGFVDQRNALEWVQDNIQAFGGDPKNVTACGVSAGSSSVHFHILSGKPLFDRGIMMSATAGTLGPLPPAAYKDAWKTFVRKYSIQDPAHPDTLRHLRSSMVTEVLEKYPLREAMGPMADGRLLPENWTSTAPQPETRCKSVIIGDCRIEAIIMYGLIKSTLPAQFIRLARESMPTVIADDFLETFNIRETMHLPAFHEAMEKFLSVILFQFPALLVAETYPGNVYYYHFEEPSPYPGMAHDLPFHGLCSWFLFQNDNDNYPDRCRLTAEEMARDWCAFAYSAAPWEEYKASSKFKRFGPGGRSSMVQHADDETRRYSYMPWLRDHIEEVKPFARKLMTLDWE